LFLSFHGGKEPSPRKAQRTCPTMKSLKDKIVMTSLFL
jgi:hypothetical protein